MNNNFAERKKDLKSIRDNFLKFHKLLMDREREKYEKEFGTLSAGKFLEMLLSDERFAWLRIISTLIVRIDEAFDVDDGISSDLVESFFDETEDLFNEDSEEYKEFKTKLKAALPDLPEAENIQNEIKALI